MGANIYSYNLLYVTTCIPVSLPHLKLISSITPTVVDSTEVLLLQTRVLLSCSQTNYYAGAYNF